MDWSVESEIVQRAHKTLTLIAATLERTEGIMHRLSAAENVDSESRVLFMLLDVRRLELMHTAQELLTHTIPKVSAPENREALEDAQKMMDNNVELWMGSTARTTGDS